MGINKNQFAFLQDHAFERCSGKKMLELGNQWMEMPDFGPGWAKTYYEENGWDHTSADRNGEGGAVKVDLTKPGHFPKNTFDIVTDHGTLEHIGDEVTGQHRVFKNLHEWGKIGCVYTHVLPLQDAEHQKINGRTYGRHGHWGYSTKFWEKFVEACGYEMIHATSEYSNLTGLRHYSCVAYIKTENSSVIGYEELKELYATHVDWYSGGSDV